MKQIKYNLSSILIIAIVSCSSAKQKDTHTAIGMTTIASNALSSVFIYKTKQDYSKNVPVNMNTRKTQVVSYPSPDDICPAGICTYPTLLVDSFWLDNRGIGKNVAFLSYTYEEYGKLPFTPDANDLLNKIIDKEPLTELYNFGKRKDFDNLESELNIKLISKEYLNKNNLINKK